MVASAVMTPGNSDNPWEAWVEEDGVLVLSQHTSYRFDPKLTAWAIPERFFVTDETKGKAVIRGSTTCILHVLEREMARERGTPRGASKNIPGTTGKNNSKTDSE